MSEYYSILIAVVAGYLVGTINPAYIISRFKGFDIRKMGSRNAGGSNALITMGKMIGIFCILFDIFKAFGIIKAMVYLFPEVKSIFAFTSTACIMGHMFPVFMNFKGGKGLACIGGSIMAYSVLLFVILFISELILAVVVDYMCVAPITVSILYPIIYAWSEDYWISLLIFAFVSVAMLSKHMENLKRIKQGTELHFSYLWKSGEEKARIKANIAKIDSTQVNSVFSEDR